jgi:membrane-anchored mycosin MYCP
VRSAYPQLSLAQITTRLEYSADHASGTIPDRSVGWGTVDPYAALALPLDRTRPPTAAPQSRIAAVVLPPRDNPHHRFLGAGLAAGFLVAALAASAALAAIRRGRRRGWKVAQATHR